MQERGLEANLCCKKINRENAIKMGSSGFDIIEIKDF